MIGWILFCVYFVIGWRHHLITTFDPEEIFIPSLYAKPSWHDFLRSHFTTRKGYCEQNLTRILFLKITVYSQNKNFNVDHFNLVFVWLGFFSSHRIFNHCQWRVAKILLIYSVSMAIEQWAFFYMPNLLWWVISIYRYIVISKDPQYSHLLPTV